MLFIMNGIRLEWWIKVNEQNTIGTVMVKKAADTRPNDIPFNGTPQGGSERYSVFSVSCTGECWRHAGLPLGWGFKLTKDRKIKEVR